MSPILGRRIDGRQRSARAHLATPAPACRAGIADKVGPGWAARSPLHSSATLPPPWATPCGTVWLRYVSVRHRCRAWKYPRLICDTCIYRFLNSASL
eukprot:scaffold3187_cov361-Prasinococcus_capsulatus_cf.AAC.15